MIELGGTQSLNIVPIEIIHIQLISFKIKTFNVYAQRILFKKHNFHLKYIQNKYIG